jgi:hypothetical protein
MPIRQPLPTAAQLEKQAQKLIDDASRLPSVDEFRARLHHIRRAVGALHLARTDARGDREDPHLLETEDEASEDESAQRINPSPLAVAKPGLYVGTSKVIGWWKGDGLGLFSAEAIQAGDLLGYYTGTWFTEEDYSNLPNAQRRKLDEYAVTVEPDIRGRADVDPTLLVVSPAISDGANRPDPTLYPMAFANEASKPLIANAAFTRVQLNADDVAGAIPDDQADGEWLGLAIYACKGIGKHREILVHYGDTFPRERYGYEAGEPCAPPASTQPPTALGRVPLAALGFVEGSASDVEDSSDESFQG